MVFFLVTADDLKSDSSRLKFKRLLGDAHAEVIHVFTLQSLLPDLHKQPHALMLS